MHTEAEELYCNLNKLLNDICKFLKDETNYEKLSPEARKRADELIGRSKRQLQEIVKIINENDCDGTYVDMEPKPPEDGDEVYAVIETVTTPPVITNHKLENPYANLPARELSQDLKYGPLSWKCKIILKFEKMKRIYAGVHHNWLLIYSSERDVKPLQTLHLKTHKAQTVQKQGKTLEQDFELVCTFGENKRYYFTAMTHKDMLQWISHINRCHESMNKSKNPSISDDGSFEICDDEDIYQDLSQDYGETFSSADTNHVTNINKPPDLPARRIIVKPKQPLPPIPQRHREDEELSETYDPVYNSNTSFDDEQNSFSEDDDDDPMYVQHVPRPSIN